MTPNWMNEPEGDDPSYLTGRENPARRRFLLLVALGAAAVILLAALAVVSLKRIVGGASVTVTPEGEVSTFLEGAPLGPGERSRISAFIKGCPAGGDLEKTVAFLDRRIVGRLLARQLEGRRCEGFYVLARSERANLTFSACYEKNPFGAFDEKWIPRFVVVVEGRSDRAGKGTVRDLEKSDQLCEVLAWEGLETAEAD